MVTENRSKHAFWQALVFTIIVFALGLITGYFFEIRQSDDIFTALVNSEINILDEQVKGRLIQGVDVSCSDAKDSLFGFADKIYEEARQLEEKDSPGRLNDLTALHRRYDILRTLLWIEARELKDRCKDDFHVVVYLYSYLSEDVDVQSQQFFYSRLLTDLKEAHTDEIILIPIAVDTGLSSVELAAKSNNVGKFPAIIIDDGKVITDVITLSELEKLVFETKN